MANVISPHDYSSVSAYDLLVAAASGHIGIDQRLMHALLDEPSKTLPDIVRFASGDWEAGPVNLEEDLIAIALRLRPPEMIPFLMDRVRAAGADVPDLLVETVCSFRAAALEPLLDLHAALGEEEETEVPFLLASLGVKDERIEEVLHRLGERDPSDAAFCWEVYREVASGTAEWPEYDIWEDYPEIADPPFDVLPFEERLEVMDAAAEEIRRAAIESFFNEPDLPAAVVDRIVEAARADSSAEVRGAAWRSLALETDDEDLRREMTDRFYDPETPALERAGLAVALAPDAEESEFQNRVIEVFERPETRAAALEAMWRSGDRSYATYVKKALDETDPKVREHALLGVGYLGLTGELGRVRAMFRDPELRPPALMAYALAMPTEVTPARMRSLFKKIEEAAGGLSPEEANVVHIALNQRLEDHGRDPVFGV